MIRELFVVEFTPLRIGTAERLRFCVVLMTVVLTIFSAAAQVRTEAPAQLTIDAALIISPVSPTLYGLMTEEINHSYDGGLYAEMIQNRAFHSTWEGEPPWGLVRRGDAIASRSVVSSLCVGSE